MKRALIITTLSTFILVHSGQTISCTAFAVKNKNGQQVAKNFDWYVGEGFVVINPRRAKRVQSLEPKSSPIQWTARYGSISFTVFSPGFPISGMNETGLVVESLHQVDFRHGLQQGDGLVSLEWVQYVLDSFQTVKEVKQFIEQRGFGQILIPLHFFISDASGNSMVVYGQGTQIKTVSAKQMTHSILANNNYHKDLSRYQKSTKQNWLTKLFSRNPEGGRFGIIARALNKGALGSNSAIFNTLQAARIPSLTKWQILWNQTQKTVSWRFFETRRPQKTSRIQFSQLDFGCQSEPLVASTHSEEPLQFSPYSRVDRTLTTVRVRAIESALETPLPRAVSLAFAKPTQCE